MLEVDAIGVPASFTINAPSLFMKVCLLTRTLQLFCQDDLLAELDELVQLDLDQSLLDIEGTENVPLPNVPSASLPSRPGKSPTGGILPSTFGSDFRQFGSGKVSEHK